MTVGDRLAQMLAESGVDRVFGVPGGQTLPLYEGIRKSGGAISHVLMRDERSAGFAADAYARLTGKVGVCDATVGPGATNLLSPLAEAHCSSIPMLAIISDIPRSWEHRRLRGNASQAMEQLEMFKPVSKWQVTLSEPASLENVLDQALRVAVSGRPGPVVLAVPDDVGDMDIQWQRRVRPSAVFPRHRSAPDPAQVQAARQALAQAQKPVLLVGGGVHTSGAGQEVAQLARLMGAPVVTTITGKGVMAETDPQVFGVTGSMGSPKANEVVAQADLVFFIACKAGQLATFGYDRPAPGVATIHLDIDPEEIGRNFPDSIALVCDARLGLADLLAALGSDRFAYEWNLDALRQDCRQWYDQITLRPQVPGEPLKAQAVTRLIDEAMEPGDLAVCDASLPSGWAAVYLRLKEAGRSYLAPRGLAGLGWGAPAAIGAALARPQAKRVFLFAGDGGYAFSMQELEVMVRLNLPVVTCLFNNNILGWIKHVQKARYGDNHISTDFNHIDFATVAQGFGARGYKVNSLDELRDALGKERQPQGPAIIDMNTDQWETPVLRNASGKA
ncbi:MAG: thiamine pyrophosphate-binding protein [Proteobacteria bacterium]|nr:thiamine pyrophosphate-binding protein [Pseudomonadota bacterium]MBU1452146.1 thiamine pyrophosphate-binding protein [Pseudomonadota bacterium]MBU2467541.1 thiamine pyrophosphate-binding protein [Pseudomonadota bacterium]MBU2518078.1 thiamine pyrophosphate-binding protein [Pseudomonadota bacterium]